MRAWRFAAGESSAGLPDIAVRNARASHALGGEPGGLTRSRDGQAGDRPTLTIHAEKPEHLAGGRTLGCPEFSACPPAPRAARLPGTARLPEPDPGSSALERANSRRKEARRAATGPRGLGWAGLARRAQVCGLLSAPGCAGATWPGHRAEVECALRRHIKAALPDT